MGLGTNLKEILKNKNMTIKELSAQTGISLNTLYSITKRDGNMARFDIIKKICEALNISESELVGFDISPEDYEGIKNPRIYEVHKKSDERTGLLLKEEHNYGISDNSYNGSLPSKQFTDKICHTLLKNELDDNFRALNPEGKRKLVDYSSDLTKIPDYQNGIPDQDNDSSGQTEPQDTKPTK